MTASVGAYGFVVQVAVRPHVLKCLCYQWIALYFFAVGML